MLIWSRLQKKWRSTDKGKGVGLTALTLLSEYGKLRKRYWGQHLWGRGYWVASSGNVTDGVWKEYIKNQKPPEPDDDFNVV